MRHASLVILFVAAIGASPAVAQDPATAPVPVSPEAAPSSPRGAPLVVTIGPEGEETPPPTLEPIPRVWAPAPRDEEGRSVYGLYLSARSALGRGEAETGAALLSATEALTPEQPAVRDQTFTAALLAGDLDIAARISPETAGASPAITEAGALVAVVQALVRGDAEAAHAAQVANPIGAPHARAGALIAPWIAAAAGDWDAALAEPNPTGDRIIVLFGRYHRALLLEHRRRFAEAETALKALTDDARTAPLFRISHGEFLERRGRSDEALALYDAAIGAGAAEPGLTRARALAAAGARPPALPSYRTGVAKALTAAAAQASAENANEFAVVYLRLSLNLVREPETVYLLGQTLAKAGLESAARAVLDDVPQTNAALYAAAQVQLGLSHARDDEDEAAMEAFRTAMAANPRDGRIAYLSASQLLQMDRFDEALQLLNSPLLNTAEQDADVRFMRGAVYESLGRIPEAEAELWAALQVDPDNPTILNYLGYLWVDSGARVAEGAEMIARAHAADPEDGNIQDSLGWAQYRQGQFDTAVETLEQAVAKEPANATINDHLGDAYWQVGRRREAGFQWSRVLTLDPDAERRAEVERKIEQGLTSPDAAGGEP